MALFLFLTLFSFSLIFFLVSLAKNLSKWLSLSKKHLLVWFLFSVSIFSLSFISILLFIIFFILFVLALVSSLFSFLKNLRSFFFFLNIGIYSSESKLLSEHYFSCVQQVLACYALVFSHHTVFSKCFLVSYFLTHGFFKKYSDEFPYNYKFSRFSSALISNLIPLFSEKILCKSGIP